MATKHMLKQQAAASKAWLCSCGGWDRELPEKGSYGSAKYSARIKALQLNHRYHVKACERAVAKAKA